MKHEELQKHINWMQHNEIQSYLKSSDIPYPWFPAYQRNSDRDYRTTWFCALVPVSLIPACLQDESWDLCLTDGHPAVCTYYDKGRINKRVYLPIGNESGIEPLVVYREFHGIRDNFLELTQEFRLYYNLYHDPSRSRFLNFNGDGNESDAVKYGTDFVQIRTDLLLRFCAIKQMALAIFVDSCRYSPRTLKELHLEETRLPVSGNNFVYHVTIVPDSFLFDKEINVIGHLLGKRYILPGPLPSDEGNKRPRLYQDFIIDADAQGQPVKHTCNPEKLSNYFGKNPGAPHYLTPVFFRAEVLSKYYAAPQKYSVEDGYLRCGGLWGIRMDNDHIDYVVVWLGDLGTYLSESERNYWMSFNIPPEGRKISKTNFQRAIMAMFADPQKPDFVFKQEYDRFRDRFYKAYGWHFFLPLHKDDEHFLTGLRTLVQDNQSEFDAQLLALTKILVDSINEKEVVKGLTTVLENDKGITKLEKFFAERNLTDSQPHINFLRILQDLRSKSAAHHKGSNYDKLFEDLQMTDEGQQKVFSALLVAAVNLVRYLQANLVV